MFRCSQARLSFNYVYNATENTYYFVSRAIILSNNLYELRTYVECSAAKQIIKKKYTQKDFKLPIFQFLQENLSFVERIGRGKREP